MNLRLWGCFDVALLSWCGKLRPFLVGVVLDGD